ncbi:prestin-like [Neocloeon triangulifer]|uniref:prestin-like n=1 Tax=Neocloeon triangulifer TaxID=2078957 RepID=UPI00286F4023|nr:prestin-like [Neocloeon triangulifer]
MSSVEQTNRTGQEEAEDDAEASVGRLIRSQESFDKLNQYEIPQESPIIQRAIEHISPSKCTGCFFSVFPFFDWIQDYKLKKFLIDDAVSGITVGVMHIPQGLAYSMLAGVPPITGLYMAFFPVLIYIFMGTSRHVSMGTFSVVCLMTKAIVAAHAKPDTVDNNFDKPPDLSFSDAFVKPDNAELTSVQVAMVVCFAVGLWQVLMGLFRLGNISVLLSDTLVSGFSTAAAVHVLASQLGSLLGVKVGKYNSNFKVILVLRDVVMNIPSLNYVSLSLSLSVMAVLIIYTEIIKHRLEKRCHFPVPVEMLCIIIGTLLSAGLELNSKYNVKCVGNIPRGIPSPSLPAFWLLPDIIFHSLPIAVIGFTITLSMASILAKKGHYKVKANQEFIACGCGNLFASFFSCVPFAASLSRSLIQQNVGGKTQIASVFSCIFILLILLAIGPFFEQLPNCVLAAIVIVSLKGMFWQVKDFPGILRRSKLDAFVWLGTLLVSIFWDIDYGLGAGLFLSVLCVLLYGQQLKISILGKVPNNEIYLDTKHYLVAQELPGIKIIHISGSLHFANKNQLEKSCAKKLDLHSHHPPTVTISKDGENNPLNSQNESKIQSVILDMSSVSFVDPSAADSMSNLREDILHKLEGHLYLANCSPNVLEALKKFNFFSGDFPIYHYVFPSIHDAVLHAQQSSLSTGL